MKIYQLLKRTLAFKNNRISKFNRINKKGLWRKIRNNKQKKKIIIIIIIIKQS